MRGSIKKRVGKRGVTWTAVVDLGHDPLTGQRKQKRLSAPTKQEVEDLCTKTLNALRTGTYLEPSNESLKTFLTGWLATLTVKPGSRLRYSQSVECRIGPSLGHLALSKLSPQKIQAHNARMLERLSPTTVRTDYQVLHMALDQAVAWGMLLRNPCQGVKPPRPARTEMQVWTAAQTKQFLNATEGCPLASLWRVALGTGMRQGELLALRWTDFDLQRRSVSVTRTWAKGPDGWAIGDVKSRAGRRQIALPASCVQALRALRVEQPGDQGALLWEMPLRKAAYWFDKTQQGLGLPRLRFHDLRHTSATLMLANGVHPKIVAERLGHSSIAITMDRYSHVVEGMQEAAADQLDALFGGPGDQNVTTEPPEGPRMAEIRQIPR